MFQGSDTPSTENKITYSWEGVNILSPGIRSGNMCDAAMMVYPHTQHSGKLRQSYHEFEARLGHIYRPLKKKTKIKKIT